MRCEIIQFAAAATSARPVISNRALTPRQRRREGKPELPQPATETAKNSRLRTARRDAWWRACRESEYWLARMEWNSALGIAQRYGIADGASFPSAENESRRGLVDTWREAVAKQLLTPAPDLGAVTWKRAKLKSSGFKHVPINAARAEQAIADDLAFLAEHPTRRGTDSETLARRRAFKEAMRRRIRDIAASRDLSDEEIKPVLGLRRREIGEFTEKHGVNLEWLLEGKGRIFENDPIWLSANMTGTELAAVVTTMPMADQQAIKTMVCEMVQQRDQ